MIENPTRETLIASGGRHLLTGDFEHLLEQLEENESLVALCAQGGRHVCVPIETVDDMETVRTSASFEGYFAAPPR